MWVGVNRNRRTTEGDSDLRLTTITLNRSAKMRQHQGGTNHNKSPEDLP
jgi:hypothetical protein